LLDHTIAARPPSRLLTAQKFVRRNRTIVVATVTLFLALAGGTIATVYQAIGATAARDDAFANRSSPSFALMERGSQQRSLLCAPATRAARVRRSNGRSRDNRGLEWWLLNADLDQSTGTFAGINSPAEQVRLSADGSMVGCLHAGIRAGLTVWSTATRRLIAHVPPERAGVIAWTWGPGPTDAILATRTGASRDLEVAAGTRVRTLRESGQPAALLALAERGAVLVALDAGGVVRRFDVTSGRRRTVRRCRQELRSVSIPVVD